MDDFFTWQMLATFAGSAAATGIITQFVKGWLSKIPMQVISYVIALVILFAATAATTGVHAGWTVWAMIPLNAVIVSMSANGAYSAVLRIKDGKPDDSNKPDT